MAVTRTTTVTKTFARVELIGLQIGIALRRAGVAESSARNVLQGASEKLIGEVSLYGLDSTKRCWAELFMKIDWRRHELHMTAGRTTVAIDAGWHDDLSVEVEMSERLFKDFCATHGLNVHLVIRYRPGVDRDAANRRLGFVRAAPVVWRGGAVGTAMSIPELDEFSVGVRLLDQV